MPLMSSATPPARDVFDPYCPSRQLLTLISQRWSVLLVHALADGPARPGELRRQVADISQKMLTQTLRNLQDAGLVDRVVFPEVPPHVEYVLTAAGRDLSALLATICAWAETHAP